MRRHVWWLGILFATSALGQGADRAQISPPLHFRCGYSPLASNARLVLSMPESLTVGVACLGQVEVVNAGTDTVRAPRQLGIGDGFLTAVITKAGGPVQCDECGAAEWTNESVRDVVVLAPGSFYGQAITLPSIPEVGEYRMCLALYFPDRSGRPIWPEPSQCLVLESNAVQIEVVAK